MLESNLGGLGTVHVFDGLLIYICQRDLLSFHKPNLKIIPVKLWILSKDTKCIRAIRIPFFRKVPVLQLHLALERRKGSSDLSTIFVVFPGGLCRRSSLESRKWGSPYAQVGGGMELKKGTLPGT